VSDNTRDQWRAAVSESVDVEPYYSLSSTVRLEIGAASACGLGRSHNSDHYLAIRLGRSQDTLATSLPASDLPHRFAEYGYALMVADGLGERAGPRASRVALASLAHLAIRYGKWNVRVDPDTTDQIRGQGEFLYRQVNEAVYEAGRADSALYGMTTSLTALYIAQDDLFFAHVGHSSAFLLRNGVLTELTASVNAKASRSIGGPLRPERATRDVGRLIAETIGAGPTAPKVEIERIKLLPADRLLLCTNGLTDVVSEGQIADALAPRRRPHHDCRRLIDMALDGGGADDVTVMLADYAMSGGQGRDYDDSDEDVHGS
jgi:protein phosphatase